MPRMLEPVWRWRVPRGARTLPRRRTRGRARRPGPADVTRDHLVHRWDRDVPAGRRAGARAIAGHEVTECPLVHPLVGRLRCGEWLLFAGVHDLMHLEQLEALEARLAVERAAGVPPSRRRPDEPVLARPRRRLGVPRRGRHDRGAAPAQRAPGLMLPGLWQCASGSLEPGERVALGALREIEEETGFDADCLDAFYDLIS